MNADPEEIAKFSQLKDDWWDFHGPCQPLHQLNPLRLSYLQQFTDLADKAIVDVGCGGGILSEGMALLGANVTGIDLAEGAIHAAKSHLHLSQLSIDYQLISVETFAKSHREQFDIVTCMEMLEHVPDPKAMVQACSDLAKPGGKLFFSTINRHPKAYLYAVVGAEWLLKILPKGTHDFSKFIKPNEFAQWARQAGLSLQDLRGIHYQPLTKKFTLKQDISVNYLICCVKP